MSTLPLIDIGLNLANASFDNDREQVLRRAHSAGISQCILTGTDLHSSEAVAQMCERYNAMFPNMLYSTAGVHPHDAKIWDNNSATTLRELAALPQVVAIGEAGLDFNRNFSPPRQQEIAFEAQLQLAAELQLPIFMHERDAHQRQLDIIKNYRDHLSNGVIHCFSGTREALFNYLDMDLHIGITGWICDERRGTELQQLVHNIPLNRLMLESDAPYLLPRNIQPKPPAVKKSRRNEPVFLPWVLQEICQHREESLETIAHTTTSTAQQFFCIQA